jgi:exonuclease III
MTEVLSLASMNVQGLGDKLKRKDVLNYLKSKKLNIYFIQDTHFTDKEINLIRSQWGFECYFSNFSSQARGVAILINNNFEFKFISMNKDVNGNLIVLKCTAYSHELTLVCIYGPNRDDPQFYENIKEATSQLDNSYIIVGDFNLILNPEKDCFNYSNINNPNAREKVLQMILENDLIDCWREQNLEEKKFTWFKKNPVKKARLDFFLISSILYTDMEKTSILPGYRSDHSMIFLSISLGKFKKGRSYWKFNNSLLKDIDYTNNIKHVIQ